MKDSTENSKKVYRKLIDKTQDTGVGFDQV